MSIFGNMMGAFESAQGMMNADSFTGGGMSEVEDALISQNVPLQSPGPQSELMGAIAQIGPGAPTEVDEMSPVLHGGDANVPAPQQGGGGGPLDNNVGRFMTGDSIAGGIASLFMGGQNPLSMMGKF